MDIIKMVQDSLDSLKRVTANGDEYWMARDLQKPLGYLTWENFEKVVEKAKMACDSTGVDRANHILDTTKKVSIGK